MNFDYTKEPGRVLLNRELKKDYKPLVTILTPFYNAGKYFHQTYNCVINQTFPFFEWIIVNDGSTNKEDVELLNKIELTDERIKVLHKDNGGISTARNLAIKHANTEIIYPLDADDLIVPTFVECLYWGLYYNPEASWCYTRNIGFHNQEYLWDKPFNAERIKTFNFLTYSGAIRKKALVEVGCYDEITKHYYEDWRTWLKLLSKSKWPVKLGFYGFWYRRLDTGVLSIVRDNPERAELAERLISEVAKTVDVSITAKEYPINKLPTKFVTTEAMNWEYKTFKEHKKINIMFIVPYMEDDVSCNYILNIIKNIDRNEAEISLITTINSVNSNRQQYEDYVTDIFELPSFLDADNYTEFISYMIKSREIDNIVISDSYYGYYLISWINKNFSNLKIVDIVNSEQWSFNNGCFHESVKDIEVCVDKTYVNNTDVQSYIINKFNKGNDEVVLLDNITNFDLLYDLKTIIKKYSQLDVDSNNDENSLNLAMWHSRHWLEKQINILSNNYKEQNQFLEKLYEDKNWIEEQWNKLTKDYSELKKWQETLQKDKDWIEVQWQDLQKRYNELLIEKDGLQYNSNSSIFKKVINKIVK